MPTTVTVTTVTVTNVNFTAVTVTNVTVTTVFVTNVTADTALLFQLILQINSKKIIMVTRFRTQIR